ncbi:hypothetical protein GGX14DRAFT_567396 [Mycena pura]|uniref:Uncharacterized protein n=1 Tax=Mycena pura TaxID=153505 RepID=A0AAD6VAH3_9AGAR|nr:hypothetical protein GGX14DRAFT_567396 [Mycena pura]
MCRLPPAHHLPLPAAAARLDPLPPAHCARCPIYPPCPPPATCRPSAARCPLPAELPAGRCPLHPPLAHRLSYPPPAAPTARLPRTAPRCTCCTPIAHRPPPAIHCLPPSPAPMPC